MGSLLDEFRSKLSHIGQALGIMNVVEQPVDGLFNFETQEWNMELIESIF